uniref:RRM domain-containing protein n=1 Tax=Pipistrellus kuhlii TaxID=59472 RepID=A0A7J8A835_PIPKU|nr:hypothetical protein mPipKuh1_008913 [Pipistrellus kuhlii]
MSDGSKQNYSKRNPVLLPEVEVLMDLENLQVFGLSLYTTERDLREVFSKHGPIVDVSIVYDQLSRRSIASVYFENVDDAKEAKECANGMELDGRRIREDTMVAMMIGTTIADHTEVVVEVEEDGELLKTGIRFMEDLLLTIVMEDIDHVPDLNHIHLMAIKA